MGNGLRGAMLEAACERISDGAGIALGMFGMLSEWTIETVGYTIMWCVKGGGMMYGRDVSEREACEHIAGVKSRLLTRRSTSSRKNPGCADCSCRNTSFIAVHMLDFLTRAILVHTSTSGFGDEVPRQIEHGHLGELLETNRQTCCYNMNHDVQLGMRWSPHHPRATGRFSRFSNLKRGRILRDRAYNTGWERRQQCGAHQLIGRHRNGLIDKGIMQTHCRARCSQCITACWILSQFESHDMSRLWVQYVPGSRQWRCGIATLESKWSLSGFRENTEAQIAAMLHSSSPHQGYSTPAYA